MNTITDVTILNEFISQANDFALKQAAHSAEIIAVIQSNFPDFTGYDIYVDEMGGSLNPFLMSQKIVAHFNLCGRKMVEVEIMVGKFLQDQLVSMIESQLGYEMRNIDTDFNDEDAEMIF